MRVAFLVGVACVSAGCTTMTYTSRKPAAVVSDCIASGWRKIPDSGAELPVSLTKKDEYYLVDVVLVRDFPTFVDFHSMWAKIRPDPSGDAGGSSTEYRRNFQIWHEKIDRVVRECQ